MLEVLLFAVDTVKQEANAGIGSPPLKMFLKCFMLKHLQKCCIISGRELDDLLTAVVTERHSSAPAETATTERRRL